MGGECFMSKILILGGAGFIGSILSQTLHEQGDEVTIFDTLFFEPKARDFSPFRLVQDDIRKKEELEPEIKRADAVVNLAALSNDPVSDLDPQLTWDINHAANSVIAELCAKYGKRIVFASSCSVYGFGQETFHEESETNPLSLYAKTKVLSEKIYEDKATDVVSLRFATAYGYTAKPRFDLVVNSMVGTAHFQGRLVVHGGSQWRPLVHVKDIARAIHLAIHAPTLPGRVYNIGSNEQNYQIIDLASHIIEFFPDAKLGREEENFDPRSYRVDFSKAEQELGFRAKHTIAEAVQEFQEAFRAGKIPSMNVDEYYRVKYLKNNFVPSLK